MNGTDSILAELPIDRHPTQHRCCLVAIAQSIAILQLDRPLWRGQVGTVVEVLSEGAAFEIEFSDRDGRTYESLGLRPEQIMVLHFEPTSPDQGC
jgi:hypothetical protein